MAREQTLEDIIRKECLPLRDCVLTITDSSGEAAFLYFKEGELIEANYAALWGKEALAQINAWKLADFAVAPLPLGIKRSLWDQVEVLLNPGADITASGRLASRPTFTAPRLGASSPFERFQAIPGLSKLVQIERTKTTVLFEAEGEESENIDWLNDFTERAKAVGETLGFGACERWTIDTDRYQVVGLNHDDSFLVILRRKDVTQDDLEAAVNDVID